MHASARPYAIAGSALLTSGMIAVMPVVQPAALRVANMDVRLVDVATDVTGALGSIDPLSSLGGLSLPDLGSLDLGGLTSDLGSLGGLSLPDLGSLDLGSLFADGSLLNIPYNLFADVVNIPFYEAEALQEYAYALGPAGTTGGVAGWVPSWFDTNTLGDFYTAGGTGSWYGESIGNTWGWDDGNWPQLDAILHFLLPFEFTNSLAQQVETFADGEFIDGAHLGCEFECANPLGYLAGWLHGDTPLASLLSGTTLPTTLTDTVPFNPPGIPNMFPPTVSVPTIDNLTGTEGTGAIWSGLQAQLNLLDPLQAIAGNLTASPSSDPIQFPNIGDVFTNGVKLVEDMFNDFNPFQTGSFLYWGAPVDYSIPSAIGGTITDFTGIPNQWSLLNLGAEPVGGYTSTPASLPSGLAEGLQFLLNGNGGTYGSGLLGYLNPETYLQALNNDIGILTNPNNLLAALPLVGYLGLGDNVTGAIAPGSLLGTFAPGFFTGPFDASSLLTSFDPASLLGGAVDPSTLTTDLSGLLGGALDPSMLTTDLSGLLGGALDPSTLTTDLSGLLGGALDPSTLTTDLSGLLPGVGTDLASLLGTNLATDLSSVLGTSAVQLVPDLALQVLSAF
jgi:hypothetical protein